MNKFTVSRPPRDFFTIPYGSKIPFSRFSRIIPKKNYDVNPSVK